MPLRHLKWPHRPHPPRRRLHQSACWRAQRTPPHALHLPKSPPHRLTEQVPEDTSVGAKEQTASVLKQIDELLARAGTDKTKILSAQVPQRREGGREGAREEGAREERGGSEGGGREGAREEGGREGGRRELVCVGSEGGAHLRPPPHPVRYVTATRHRALWHASSTPSHKDTHTHTRKPRVMFSLCSLTHAHCIAYTVFAQCFPCAL